MAYRILRSTGWPRPLRLVFGLCSWLASLRLAVVLISAAAVVLMWAAFYLDARYGNKVVQFAVYGSWWFAGLAFLLGVNVVCAALGRFPWDRKQTGFVITHAGIVVLLLGCWLTRRGGIDAQLPVFEGTASHLAFQDTQHFELVVYSPRQPAETASPPRGNPGDQSVPAGSSSQDVVGEIISIPFAAGPFNWDDYRRMSWFPWRLARRDRGVLFDEDGIRLEVLDYYSDAELLKPRPLKLRVKCAVKGGADPAWQEMELNADSAQSTTSTHRAMRLGSMEELSGGGQIDYWVAGSQAETEAFLQSKPEGPLSKLGQLVLFLGGRRFVIPVEKLQAQSRVPLGATGLEVQLERIEPTFQAVVLRILAAGQPAQQMKLIAGYPQFNQQDDENGVFGTYWAPEPKRAPGDPPSQPGSSLRSKSPRVDILQGADQKLYYRVWKSPRVEHLGELPSDGTRMLVLEKTDAPITFYVEQFLAHDRPGQLVSPRPFSSARGALGKQRQARVRLTVDGQTEEFWLEGVPMVLDPAEPLDPAQRRVVAGDRRRVAISMPWDQVDVGFQVYLHKFDRRLDPGTSMPSHYSSLVDFRDPENPETPLQSDVRIALNSPADFSDPRTGRSYRLFQESFDGPYKPGNPRFDKYVAASSPRDELFLSILTVNYDPGRGLKYAGSLLIVVGLATMFYMRAYFFRRHAAGHLPRE